MIGNEPNGVRHASVGSCGSGFGYGFRNRLVASMEGRSLALGLIIVEAAVVAVDGLLAAGLQRSHAEILGRLPELDVSLASPPP